MLSNTPVVAFAATLACQIGVVGLCFDIARRTNLTDYEWTSLLIAGAVSIWLPIGGLAVLHSPEVAVEYFMLFFGTIIGGVIVIVLLLGGYVVSTHVSRAVKRAYFENTE